MGRSTQCQFPPPAHRFGPGAGGGGGEVQEAEGARGGRHRHEVGTRGEEGDGVDRRPAPLRGVHAAAVGAWGPRGRTAVGRSKKLRALLKRWYCEDGPVLYLHTR